MARAEAAAQLSALVLAFDDAVSDTLVHIEQEMTRVLTRTPANLALDVGAEVLKLVSALGHHWDWSAPPDETTASAIGGVVPVEELDAAYAIGV